MSSYESAWDDLKAWLEGQRDYIVIPVIMISRKVSELEGMWVEE